MVKRFCASYFRATIATSDKMLTRRLPWVFPFELLYSKSPWSSAAAVASDVTSTSGCSSAPSFSWTSLPTKCKNSFSQAIVPCLNLSQGSEIFYKSASRKHLSKDSAVARPCESKWISSSAFKGPIYGHYGFATAAIHIEEPGKYWKGKGWNRVGQEENGEVGNEADPSTAAQFDAIPEIEEKLKFLETCGLGDSQLEQMRKRLPSAVKNTFLKLSIKKLIEVAIFMEEEVGVERKDFGNILFANPFIAGSRVDECLRPKIVFLRNRGISKEQMGRMVLRSPQILTYSLKGKLLAMEKKLLEVGLKDDEIGKIFIKHPGLLGTSIGKFDKNVQSLRDGGITEVAKAIIKLPQIMSLSLDRKVQQIMEFLRDELNLQQEQVSKILSCQVSILSFSVQENIRPKVGFFSEMGLQQEDIARLVVKYPNLFCHSLDNAIKPKVQYLLTVMNRDVLELISFPHYMSYSLQSRIIPRHEYVVKHRLNYRLSSLLSCSEDVFQKRYPKPLYSEVVESIVRNV